MTPTASDGTDAGPSVLIEHWNGKAWKYAEHPGYSGGFFNAIVPLSASNIWAVGTAADANSGDFTGTRIQHWNGATWTDVATPPAGLGANLWGAAAVSPNSIWAVGWSYTSSLSTDRWSKNGMGGSGRLSRARMFLPVMRSMGLPQFQTARTCGRLVVWSSVGTARAGRSLYAASRPPPS